MFLKSRQCHYQNIPKGEEVPGDYQGANFIRINKLIKGFKNEQNRDSQGEEWTKVPDCCKDISFDSSAMKQNPSQFENQNNQQIQDQNHHENAENEIKIGYLVE